MSKVYYTPEEKINSLLTILEKRDKEIKRKDFVIRSLLNVINTLGFKTDIPDDEKCVYVSVEDLK